MHNELNASGMFNAHDIRQTCPTGEMYEGAGQFLWLNFVLHLKSKLESKDIWQTVLMTSQNEIPLVLMST